MARKLPEREPQNADARSKEPPAPPARSPTCKPNDYFCQAANDIDLLSQTDPATARARWKAAKESAQTDDSGAVPPELLTGEAIAKDINYPVAALVNLKILLSIRRSYDYARVGRNW